MRQRVFTYITRNNELLVLNRDDGNYVEPQIPGGTIKTDELPERAAMREAQEETGLESLELVRFLGCFERNLAEIGRDETITAWFFHLRTSDSTPQSWSHIEPDPSEADRPVEFRLYWVPLDEVPRLGGIDCAMLQELKESVQKGSEA